MKQLQLKDSKWFYVLLSVCLATAFWMFVRTTADVKVDQVIRSIPVNLAGERVLEDQGMTVKAISNETVDLTVNVPLSVLNRLKSNNMTVTVNVSKCSVPGEYPLDYDINWPPNVSPDDLRLDGRSPAKITITVDKLDSSTFAIEPRLQGSVAEGYQAGKWSLSQETVTISGSVDQVSQIAKVEAVLQAEELTERFAGDVPLTLLDKDGHVLTDLDVKLSLETVYVTLPVVVVKQVPLTVNYISGGGVDAESETDYTPIIFPQYLTVSGAEEDMEALTEISLGSVDLAKVVGTSSFTFPIALDPRLENVSGVNEATVTVSVNNLDTRTFNVDKIDLIVPQGRSAEAITQECNIVVRGHKEDLDKVDRSQISIVADLTGVTTVGSVTVPVNVYLNASQKVGVIGAYNIVVKIS